jgi:OmpA-OmpF porin, OOP family
MTRRVAFAAIASWLLAAAAPAIAAEPSCEKFEMPGGPVYYDPFVIFFDSGSAAITPQAGKILDDAASVYRPLMHCRLDVEAHADRVGSTAQNLALSRRRAEAILAYLRKRGVRARARIEYFGETRPLVETEDGVAEPQNRFATILIGAVDGP